MGGVQELRAYEIIIKVGKPCSYEAVRHFRNRHRRATIPPVIILTSESGYEPAPECASYVRRYGGIELYESEETPALQSIEFEMRAWWQGLVAQTVAILRHRIGELLSSPLEIHSS